MFHNKKKLLRIVDFIKVFCLFRFQNTTVLLESQRRFEHFCGEVCLEAMPSYTHENLTSPLFFGFLAFYCITYTQVKKVKSNYVKKTRLGVVLILNCVSGIHQFKCVFNSSSVRFNNYNKLFEMTDAD